MSESGDSNLPVGVSQETVGSSVVEAGESRVGSGVRPERAGSLVM